MLIKVLDNEIAVVGRNDELGNFIIEKVPSMEDCVEVLEFVLKSETCNNFIFSSRYIAQCICMHFENLVYIYENSKEEYIIVDNIIRLMERINIESEGELLSIQKHFDDRFEWDFKQPLRRSLRPYKYYNYPEHSLNSRHILGDEDDMSTFKIEPTKALDLLVGGEYIESELNSLCYSVGSSLDNYIYEKLWRVLPKLNDINRWNIVKHIPLELDMEEFDYNRYFMYTKLFIGMQEDESKFIDKYWNYHINHNSNIETFYGIELSKGFNYLPQSKNARKFALKVLAESLEENYQRLNLGSQELSNIAKEFLSVWAKDISEAKKEYGILKQYAKIKSYIPLPELPKESFHGTPFDEIKTFEHIHYKGHDLHESGVRIITPEEIAGNHNLVDQKWAIYWIETIVSDTNTLKNIGVESEIINAILNIDLPTDSIDKIKSLDLERSKRMELGEFFKVWEVKYKLQALWGELSSRCPINSRDIRTLLYQNFEVEEFCETLDLIKRVIL